MVPHSRRRRRAERVLDRELAGAHTYWSTKLPPPLSPLPDAPGEGGSPLMMLVAICCSWLLERLGAPAGALVLRSCSTLESSELLETPCC